MKCAETSLPGTTVREVLDAYFKTNPSARSYILDDQGALRQHMNLFVDGARVADRRALSDPISPSAELFVIQALSGG